MRACLIIASVGDKSHLGDKSQQPLVILSYLVFKYKAIELSVGRAITENNALFWGVNKLSVLPLIGTEILAI